MGTGFKSHVRPPCPPYSLETCIISRHGWKKNKIIIIGISWTQESPILSITSTRSITTFLINRRTTRLYRHLSHHLSKVAGLGLWCIRESEFQGDLPSSEHVPALKSSVLEMEHKGIVADHNCCVRTGEGRSQL